MRRLANLGHHEKRQGYASQASTERQETVWIANATAEFSGTLLGFDDYVSMLSTTFHTKPHITC